MDTRTSLPTWARNLIANITLLIALTAPKDIAKTIVDGSPVRSSNTIFDLIDGLKLMETKEFCPTGIDLSVSDLTGIITKKQNMAKIWPSKCLLTESLKGRQMKLTPELTKEYENLYKAASVKAGKVETMKWYTNKIQRNQARYEAVSGSTKVPWWVIACIHMMESSADFGTHLHNGDPLSARTVHVPAGRPKTHDAPFTWEESAIDALGYDGATGIKEWNLVSTLHFLHGFNGFGYFQGAGQHTTPPRRSPYLWSYTDQYLCGRYVADGKFDPNAVSGQAGCVAMLKSMEARGLIKPLGTPQEPKPEPVEEPKPVAMLQVPVAAFEAFVSACKRV
jgi:lysozyme family protein